MVWKVLACMRGCNAQEQMKKSLREMQALHAGCSKAEPKISPAADPLPGGAERPKFNQLETVTTFTYKPSLVTIDARNFELSCNRPTHTYPTTHRQDWLQYTALQLACSVMKNIMETTSWPRLTRKMANKIYCFCSIRKLYYGCWVSKYYIHFSGQPVPYYNTFIHFYCTTCWKSTIASFTNPLRHISDVVASKPGFH